MANTLTQLWQQYHQRLLGYVRRRLNDPDEAQDVVQTIFLKVHQHPPGPMSPEHLEAWLWQVTRHALVDHWRKRSRRPAVVLADDDEQLLAQIDAWAAQGEPAEANPRLHMSCCLEAMVKQLPDPYRQTIDMADLQQQPYRDIAHVLGVTESAIKSRVKRAREKLRDQLVQCCEGDCHCADSSNTQGCCHETDRVDQESKGTASWA